MSEVHKLEVVIEASNAKLTQIARESMQATKRMTSAINAEMKKIQSPAEVLKNSGAGDVMGKMRGFMKQLQLATGIKVHTDEYKKLQGDVAAAEQAIRKLRAEEEQLKKERADEGLSRPYRKAEAAARDAEKALEGIRKKQEELETSDDAYEFTPRARSLVAEREKERKRLKELQAEMGSRSKQGLPFTYITDDGSLRNLGTDAEEAAKRLEEINQKLEELDGKGKLYQPTEEMRKLEERAEAAADKLGKCRDAMVSLSADGKKNGTPEWIKNQAKLRELTQQVETAGNALDSLAASGRDVEASVTGIKNLSTKGISKTFSGMQSVLKKVTSGIRSAGGAFAALIQRFRSGLPHMNRFRNALKRTGDAGRGLGGMFRTIGMSARFMFASFLITGAVNNVKNGMQSLAQYSQTTNANLSALKSGLTQLQNSFAAAFAPVLSAVVPILDTLISYLVAAVNAVGQFFAALTGQGSYTVAKRVATDFAAGANAAGAAAGGAADNAERLQRTLMGFDEINKLDDSSSGSGGSGGGGGGGAGAGDLFTTETVTNQFADFAAKIKAAWTDADFTEIGSIIGTKLKEGLDRIPWEEIQGTAKKVGKSVATLINGFVETADLGSSIGNTVAQAINTGVLGANSFLADLHWESVGQFVADGLNRFIRKANWKGAGEAVKNGLNGVFRLASTWSGKFDFKAAGNAVKTAVNSALSGISWKDAQEAASNIGRGIAEALNRVITPETFGNLGTTIAEALNTVISGAYKFLGTVEWKGWGEAIATGINRFFDRLDWEKAGLTFYKAAKGILTTLITAIRKVNWDEIGERIGYAIRHIPWDELLEDVGKLIWEAINAGIETWKGSFKEAPIETTIVTALFGLKFTGLGAKLGSFLWGKLKGLLGLGGAAAGGAAVSGAGGASVAGGAAAAGGATAAGGAAAVGLKTLLGAAAKGFGIVAVLEVLRRDIEHFKYDPNNYIEPEYNAPLPSMTAGDYSMVPDAEYNQNHMEITVPVKADPVTVKITKKQFTEAIEKVSKKSAVKTSVVAEKMLPGAGAVLGGVAAVISSATRSTGLKPLDHVAARIVEVLKEGDPQLRAIRATVSSTRAQTGVRLSLQDVLAYASEAGWMSDADKRIQVEALTRTVGWHTNPNKKVSVEAFTALVSWTKNADKTKDVTAYTKLINWAKGANKKMDVTAQTNKVGWQKNANKALGILAQTKGVSFVKGANKALSVLAKTSKVGWLQGASQIVKVVAKIIGQSNTPTIKANVNANRISGYVDRMATGGILQGGSWQPVTAAAGGGAFSTGQMFIAREAGPELVGTIGGHTAVMNNNQIVGSVSAGVYQAVLAAMSQVGGNRQVNVKVVLEGDAAGVFRVVKQENDRIVLTTGQPALLT